MGGRKERRKDFHHYFSGLMGIISTTICGINPGPNSRFFFFLFRIDTYKLSLNGNQWDNYNIVDSSNDNDASHFFFVGIQRNFSAFIVTRILWTDAAVCIVCWLKAQQPHILSLLYFHHDFAWSGPLDIDATIDKPARIQKKKCHSALSSKVYLRSCVVDLATVW